MTHRIKFSYLPLLLPLLVLTGCFSLSREEPPQQHYVLGESQRQEARPAADGRAGLSVGLRRVQVAGYLNTPLIVVRQGPHAIRFAEFHRWGEGLGGGINRVVAGHLAPRAAFETINVVPWPPQTRHDYLIQLHLLRFEGQALGPAAAEGEAYLLANWEILNPHDGAVIARGTTDYRADGWAAGDYGELVALLDAGVRELSDDLARSLEALVRPR